MCKSVNAFAYLLVVSMGVFLVPSSSFAGFLDHALHKAEGSVANKINDISQHISSTQQASGEHQDGSNNGGKSLTKTPAGQTSFADKITVLSGTTYVTHYVKKTAEPIPAVYPGISLDVLGIKPGMNVEAVKRILVSHYKSAPRAISSKATLVYKTLSLSSQPYVGELVENKDSNDIMDVWFGSPATGNTVIGIYRRLQFSENTAPQISQLIAALDKKYGPETNMGPNNGGRMRWYFGQHSVIRSCSNGSCPSSTLDPMLTDPFVASAGNPYGGSSASLDHPAHYYPRVAADVAPLLADESRAAWVAVSLNDATDGVLSFEEAKKQLHAAGVADYKKVVKPATPQL